MTNAVTLPLIRIQNGAAYFSMFIAGSDADSAAVSNFVLRFSDFIKRHPIVRWNSKPHPDNAVRIGRPKRKTRPSHVRKTQKDTNRIAKQHLTELETPCLILAQDKLLDNLARMRERARRLGVRLRPHGKTAKSSRVAGLALEGLPKSITVSTLAEADHYFENGISDIIYAVGIAPVKLDHVAALMAAGADIKILLDSMTQADHGCRKRPDGRHHLQSPHRTGQRR